MTPDATMPVAKRRFQKRQNVTGQPLQCVVMENGVPCSRPPEHRGVCHRHRKLIGQHRGYSIARFYLPEPEVVLETKLREELADGLCRVIEDGQHCRKHPHVRGLCRRHYRMAIRRDLLDALASPPRDLWNRFGPGNDRPHFYLDKNLLFDHADNAVFGSPGQAASVAIIERVIQGDARASVSTDAIKSTYNHVRHRLMRPTDEGGREMPEDEAESLARKHVQKTFYGHGTWRIVSLDATTFGKIVATGDHGLSLEDALEFQAYQLARAGKAGPTMFVTRDADFPEGVHPTYVAREFDWT